MGLGSLRVWLGRAAAIAACATLPILGGCIFLVDEAGGAGGGGASGVGAGPVGGGGAGGALACTAGAKLDAEVLVSPGSVSRFLDASLVDGVLAVLWSAGGTDRVSVTRLAATSDPLATQEVPRFDSNPWAYVGVVPRGDDESFDIYVSRAAAGFGVCQYDLLSGVVTCPANGALLSTSPEPLGRVTNFGSQGAARHGVSIATLGVEDLEPPVYSVLSGDGLDTAAAPANGLLRTSLAGELLFNNTSTGVACGVGSPGELSGCDASEGPDTLPLGGEPSDLAFVNDKLFALVGGAVEYGLLNGPPAVRLAPQNLIPGVAALGGLEKHLVLGGGSKLQVCCVDKPTTTVDCGPESDMAAGSSTVRKILPIDGQRFLVVRASDSAWRVQGYSIL